MDKLITSVNISQEDIAKRGESRQLNISGTNGAKFILQVVNSEGKFYNFLHLEKFSFVQLYDY